MTTKVRLVTGVCASRVQIPNGISIGSAAVAGLMLVANRQTDRETDIHTQTDRDTDRQRDRKTDRQGRFAIGRLGLVVADLCTKFKVSHIITKADKHTGIARECGPHRAALARGGKRAKIVFKNSRENSDCIISYVFACNKTMHYALQLQRIHILSILGYNTDLYSSFQNLRRKGGTIRAAKGPATPLSR